MEEREKEGKYRLGTEERKNEYIQANRLTKKAAAKAKWIAYRGRHVQKLRRAVLKMIWTPYVEEESNR